MTDVMIVTEIDFLTNVSNFSSEISYKIFLTFQIICRNSPDDLCVTLNSLIMGHLHIAKLV